jgi:hypothetical protein
MSAADHSEELERLRKQQQDRIALDIANACAGVERIERHLNKMREEYARAETVRDVDLRVRKIEVGWGKLLGMCLAIQLFGGGLIAVLTLLKK